MAGDLHHTAQPPTLAAFRPWGSSAGAGRVRPAAANIGKNFSWESIRRDAGNNAKTQRDEATNNNSTHNRHTALI